MVFSANVEVSIVGRPVGTGLGVVVVRTFCTVVGGDSDWVDND